MGRYVEEKYFGVEWRVFEVGSLEEGITAIQGGEEAFRFISGLDIGPDGAKKVAAELLNNRTLKILSLDYNNIGDEGAGSLAEVLKVNSTLTTLNLRGNDIGDAGAGSLAEALKVNSTLTYLSLDGNFIGPEGAGSLAEALKVNSTLTLLDLESDYILNAGAGLLLEALKENTTLTTLERDDRYEKGFLDSLELNEINIQGLVSLLQVLNVNQALKSLKLQNLSVCTEYLYLLIVMHYERLEFPENDLQELASQHVFLAWEVNGRSLPMSCFSVVLSYLIDWDDSYLNDWRE